MSITALITGGSGEIAGFTRPFLRERGWHLRLLDLARPSDLHDDEVWVEASILDEDAVEEAARGADVVIHLAAHRTERSWADILSVNIDGTQRVLAAAQRAGVTRVLVASSVHAVGFVPQLGSADAEVLVPRPDTYYGVSKAAGEALASVFADKHDMSIVSARINNATEHPEGEVGRIAWWAPADAARLFAAVAALDRPGHHIVWGVSRGAGRWFPLGPGRAIGYDPQEDATRSGDGTGEVPYRVGGDHFPAWPLGEPMG